MDPVVRPDPALLGENSLTFPAREIAGVEKEGAENVTNFGDALHDVRLQHPVGSGGLWSALWSTVWGGSVAAAVPSHAQNVPPSAAHQSSSPSRGTALPSREMHKSVHVDVMAVKLGGLPVRTVASRAIGQICIALWDNISGPRVEHVWTKDWTLNPPQQATSSKLSSNIIEDYIGGGTPTEPLSKSADCADIVPSHGESATGLATEEPSQPSHLEWSASSSPMDLANYVARYTLGGELVEIAGANMTSNRRDDTDTMGKSPSFFDPLYLSSSPTASAPSMNASAPTGFDSSSVSADPAHGEEADLIPPRSVSDQRALPIDYKMHVFDEANYFTEAAVFTAPYVNPFLLSPASSVSLPRGQKTKFALSVLLPKEFLSGYLRHHEAMLDRLQQLVVLYLYLLQLRPVHANTLLHHPLLRLVAQMNDLLCISPTLAQARADGTLTAAYSACSRRQPSLGKTVFCNSDLNSLWVGRSVPTLQGGVGEERASASVRASPARTSLRGSPSTSMLDFATAFVSASENGSATPGGSAKVPTSSAATLAADAETQQQRQRRSKVKAFLSLVATSHLQTHFRTVVLGDDLAIVNQYVNTLLLLVPAEDRERCAEAAVGRGYVPDLLVQGVLGKRVPDEAVIQAIWPTTLVDLNAGIVTQTYPFHEYKVLRREYQKSVIQRLLRISNRATNLWTAQESVFQQVKEPSPLLKKVVSETLRVSAYLRPGYFAACLKGLMAKSYVLIKYVEAFSRQQQVRLERERRRELLQQQQLQKHVKPLSTHTEGLVDRESLRAASQSRRSSPSPLPAAIPIALTPATAAAAAAAAASSGTGVGSASVALTSAGTWTAQVQQAQHPYPIEFTSSPHLLQRIQRDLDLSVPCYYVLIGLAELVKPGIYRALSGDPASQELRWIELFESF